MLPNTVGIGSLGLGAFFMDSLNFDSFPLASSPIPGRRWLMRGRAWQKTK